MDFTNLYIVRQSNGSLYRFYYENRKGIYSEMLEDNIWTGRVIMEEDIKNNFIVLLKDNDEIEILLEDACGNIQKVNYSNAFPKNQIILHKKTSVDYNLHFEACYEGDNLHIFYNIPGSSGGDEALIHQILFNSGDWSPPKYIDTLNAGGNHNFRAVGLHGDIYIIYTNLKDEYTHLVYKKYSSDRNSWSSSFTVDKSPLFFTDYSCIPTLESIHILYIKKEESKYKLLYKSANTENTTPLLVYEDSAIKNCSLTLLNDNLQVCWTCGENIFTCSFPYEVNHLEHTTLTINSNKTNVLKAYYLANCQNERNLKLTRDIFIDAETLNKILSPDSFHNGSLNEDNNSFDYAFEASTNDIDLYINQIKNIFGDNHRQMALINKELKYKDDEIYELRKALKNKDIEQESLQNSLLKLRMNFQNVSKLNSELKEKKLALEQKLFTLEQKLKLQNYRLHGYQDQIDHLNSRNIDLEREVESLKKLPYLPEKQDCPLEAAEPQSKRSLLDWIFEDDVIN